MSSELVVEDLHKDDLLVEYELEKYYRKVLYECCEHIRRIHKYHRKYKTVFKVPQIIPEDDRYNPVSCILYITRAMRNAGFFVRYIEPDIIYFSWINKTKEKRRLDEYKSLYLEHLLTKKTLYKGDDDKVLDKKKENSKQIEYVNMG